MMKYVFSIMIVLMATISHAEMTTDLISALESDGIEPCKMANDISGMIMWERQRGTGMDEMMSMADNMKSDALAQDRKKDGELVVQYFKNLVMDAYSQPRHKLKKDQDFTISEFKNQNYLQCMKLQETN